MEILENIIEQQSGTAFHIARGSLLRINCPKGGLVSDLTAFNSYDPEEYLFNGKTFEMEGKISLGKGNTLYSNKGNPLLEIIDDNCGSHDFLLAPCQDTHHDDGHGSCFENLHRALEPFGVHKDHMPTTLSLFKKVSYDSEGNIRENSACSEDERYVVLKAHTDLLIGLTACPVNGNIEDGMISYSVQREGEKITA